MPREVTLRRIVVLLLFVAVSAGSLLASALLLPFLKEGFGIEELALFAGVAAALLTLAALWWLVHRPRGGGLYWVGLALLAPPLCAYLFLCVRVVANDWRGRRLAKAVRVLSLRETEIRWPGLSGPIGIRMDLELEHAIGLEGNLQPPKVVMAEDPRPTVDDYYYGPMDRGVDAMLEVNVYQPGDALIPRDLLLEPGRARVSYELFPTQLQRRDGPALCLVERRVGSGSPEPATPVGSNLGAAWFFASSGGVVVDLGAVLTDALRRWSSLQGRPEEWQRLMRRLLPGSLEAGGFRRCTPPRPGSFEVCYCAPEAARP